MDRRDCKRYNRAMKQVPIDRHLLLGDLRLGEVAGIAGVPEATLANWHRFRFLPTPPIKGKWRRYGAEHTESAILMAALVQGIGMKPSRAAKLVRERHLAPVTLEDQGLGDLAGPILRYTEDCMIRARALFKEKVEEEWRTRKAARIRNAQRAIAELLSEDDKVSLLRDMLASVAPEYAVPVLLLAAGSLDEDAKMKFLHSFLCANREAYGRIIINSLMMLPPELRTRLSDVLSEGEEQKRQIALREVCESFGLPPGLGNLN